MSNDARSGIWAEGWVEEPRALHRSDLYRSLTPEQREVVHALYRLANYKPGRLASGMKVAPGQVARSLRSIAAEAGVSIKVVRTTLRRITSGTDRDGIGPLVGISEGTPAGTRTRLITLCHYPRSRVTHDETGTLPDTDTGTQRARSGHEKGTERKKERREKGISTLAEGEGSKLADNAADSPHRDLTLRLEATFAEVKGASYGHSGARDGKAVADLLRLSAGDVAEIDRRWRQALALGSKWPGCASLAHLRDRWNDLADPAGPSRSPRVRVGDLGVHYGEEWWNRLSADDAAAFKAERERLDPELIEAPPNATGAANVRAVEALIDHYRRRALPARHGASA